MQTSTGARPTPLFGEPSWGKLVSKQMYFWLIIAVLGGAMRMMIGGMARGTVWLLALVIALAAPVPALAESPPSSPRSPASIEIPDDYRLNLLIRTTLIALNQANATRNYTVLRDLSAPGFRNANSAARLGEIFAALRQRNLDLSPILFFEPKLIRPPEIDGRGMLRLSGFIPSQPEQVWFDFLFQHVDNRWQLFAISVDVRPPSAPKAAVPGPPEVQKGSAPKEQKASPRKDKK